MGSDYSFGKKLGAFISGCRVVSLGFIANNFSILHAFDNNVFTNVRPRLLVPVMMYAV